MFLLAISAVLLTTAWLHLPVKEQDARRVLHPTRISPKNKTGRSPFFCCFDFGGVLTTEWLSLPMKENRTLSVGARDADA